MMLSRRLSLAQQASHSILARPQHAVCRPRMPTAISTIAAQALPSPKYLHIAHPLLYSITQIYPTLIALAYRQASATRRLP